MFLFKNDFGIDLILNVKTQDCMPADISAVPTREFEFAKPDGTIVTKSASFVTDGTDGVLKYTIESGLLDVIGTWTVRPKLSDGSTKTFRGEKVAFAVKA